MSALRERIRRAQEDLYDIASDSRDLEATIESGENFSLEVFVRENLDEPVDLADKGDGFIWAPILRSGTLAVRPGPNGQKVRKPLKFIAGRSADPKREIGLQDLVDAFEENAIQHVTLPTTHDNNVMDNTGFIRKLKIVDSKLRPGERVLMAAHDFTEPDVRGKVERGTIANRSCGILYDYVNTDTGNTYPVALEHVALTNRPWVTGMASYGQKDFADRDVYSVALSDEYTPLADDTSRNTWDGSAGRFSDREYIAACLIKGRTKADSHLPVREPNGTLNANAVHAAASRIGSVKGISDAQRRSAARALVSLYGQLRETPPPSLRSLASVSTRMSEREVREDLRLADAPFGDSISANWVTSQLTEVMREMRRLGREDMEMYGSPYYGIQDVEFATSNSGNALMCVDYGSQDSGNDSWVVPWRVEQDGNENKLKIGAFSEWKPVERRWVESETSRDRQNELDEIFNAPSPDELFAERLRPSNGRGQNQPGGLMSFTDQELDRLGLSDEAREAIRRKQAEEAVERARERAEYKRLLAETRADKVKNRITELGEQGFRGMPGVLKAVEQIYLGDDGDTAMTLKLSDNGVEAEANLTATQIIDRVLDAFPKRDGRVDLSEVGNLLQSPITSRSPDRPEERAKEKTTDETLSEWEELMPGAADALGIRLESK